MIFKLILSEHVFFLSAPFFFRVFMTKLTSHICVSLALNPEGTAQQSGTKSKGCCYHVSSNNKPEHQPIDAQGFS